MGNIVYFGACAFREETFILGEDINILWGWHVNRRRVPCEFIKVTPKGFNFLNLETNKCVFKHHLYTKRYVGKEIPNCAKTFTVRVSDNLRLERITQEQEKTA